MPAIAAGLGVIPRVVGRGPPDHDGKLTLAEAAAADRHLLASLSRAACARSSPRARTTFGTAILFDCHSMPHDALNAAPLVPGPAAGRDSRRPLRRCLRPLADRRRHRRLHAAGLLRRPQCALRRRLHHPDLRAAPAGVHALQIEIDRALYMDEAANRADAEFPRSRTASRASSPILPATGPAAVADGGGVGAAGIAFPATGLTQKKRPCTRHGPSLGRKRP